MGYTVEPNQIFCAASEQAGQKSLLLIEADCAIGVDTTPLPLLRRERQVEGATLAADGAETSS